MAIQHLRNEFDVPFVGIEPAFKPAALQSKTKKVGVLATKGTLNSTLFNETYRRFGRNIKATIRAGSGLVELIEAGKKDSPEMRQLLYRYLQPMIANDCDHIVLGCTHYPFLKDLIQEITPEHVEIIDSGAAVAQQTKRILQDEKLLNSADESSHTFLTNGSQTVLRSLLSELNAENYTVLDYQ
jgi:glutamate racemase